MQFVTGSSRVPLQGFKALQGLINIVTPLNAYFNGPIYVQVQLGRPVLASLLFTWSTLLAKTCPRRTHALIGWTCHPTRPTKRCMRSWRRPLKKRAALPSSDFASALLLLIFFCLLLFVRKSFLPPKFGDGSLSSTPYPSLFFSPRWVKPVCVNTSRCRASAQLPPLIPPHTWTRKTLWDHSFFFFRWTVPSNWTAWSSLVCPPICLSQQQKIIPARFFRVSRPFIVCSHDRVNDSPFRLKKKTALVACVCPFYTYKCVVSFYFFKKYVPPKQSSCLLKMK